MGVYRTLLENREAIARFRATYHIPDDVQFRLDDPTNPLDGYIHHDGWMPFPLVAVVEGGVRFPLHSLLRTCLNKWNLCPCQLLPNGFKIIMGVVELNRTLTTSFGVYDIEDTYDLCKSRGDFHYLRVKVNRESFVMDMEDSHKYAGNDRLFVTGNWEFSGDEPAAHRVFKVPRDIGIPPNAHQRKEAAKRVGWFRKEESLLLLYRYEGHNKRAAWSLLGYKPRHRSTQTRKVSIAEGGSQGSTKSEAQATEQAREEAEQGDMWSKTPLILRDFRAEAFEEPASQSSSAPPDSAAVGSSASVMVSQPIPSQPVLTTSSAPTPVHVSAPPISPERRIGKRTRTEGRGEGGSGLISQPLSSGPALWNPNFHLEPGKPMTVEDRILGRINPPVLAALGRACALPQDMVQLREMDDEMLLLSSMQSSFGLTQKLQVALERFQQFGPAVLTLQAEKRRLQTALACLESQKNDFEAKLQAAAEREAELKLWRDEAAARLKAKNEREAELEKQRDEAEAKLQSELVAARQDGANEATERYADQFATIKNEAWRKGWLAALKQAKVPENH